MDDRFMAWLGETYGFTNEQWDSLNLETRKIIRRQYRQCCPG